MASLIEQIKADQLAARKARLTSKATLLTTLLGEAQTIGKNANRETTDAEVVEVIKKFIKNIDFSLNQNISDEARMDLLLEKGVLDLYLPKQLDSNQMFEIIKKIRVEKGALLELKDIMGSFKAQFAGMYDGKNLATVAKEYLTAQV